jgi:hypothetical protein
MSGFLGKLKEKKGEWDQKQEENKVADIQRQIDNLFREFEKDFAKQLGKMGLSPGYSRLMGVNAKAREGGSIVAKFSDAEGHPVTLVETQSVYDGTSRGIGNKIYWPTAFWGTIVKGSAPSTLIFKEVSQGFMKGTSKVFLPFLSTSFNENELLNSQELRKPLLNDLNGDQKLCDLVSKKFVLSCSVPLSRKTWLDLKCGDIAGKCIIVPAGEETGVILRNYGGYGDTKAAVEALSRIRGHILSHPPTEKGVGMVPAPWVGTVYALVKATSEELSRVGAT